MIKKEKVPPSLDELSRRVEKLAGNLVETRAENVRLAKLLGAAEAKIKKLGNGGGAPEGVNVLELTRLVEKMKNERRQIKSRVEQIAQKLARFYRE